MMPSGLTGRGARGEASEACNGSVPRAVSAGHRLHKQVEACGPERVCGVLRSYEVR